MKVFKAEEARARVAEYNAECDRIAQKRTEEIAEEAFDKIRKRSANGGRYITLSICDINTRKRVVEILQDAGYKIQDDFSRVWVKWGE